MMLGVLKRALKILAVCLACYLVASVIEAGLVLVIAYGRGQGGTLTVNTADMIGFYLIWFALYFFVGRRVIRRMRSG
jgi:hypothetical protein